MKKILLSLLTLFVATAASAQLQVTCYGQEVKEGETLTIAPVVNDYGGGYLRVQAGNKKEPVVKNLSGEDGTIRADLTIGEPLRVLSETACIEWCGITTICQEIKTKTASRSNTMLADATMDLAIDCTFTDEVYEDVPVKVELYWNDKKVQTFTLLFSYTDPSHIAQVADDSGVRVHFTGEGLQYAFDKGMNQAARQLQVVDAEGRLVLRQHLGTQGTASLAALPHGVYVYNILLDGKKTVTRKIVIR